jgi:type II secretory pathway component GspD/PulD (secretin)
MFGLELVAGYLAAWAVRKARRAGQQLDQDTNDIIDAALDRLHEIIAAKLGHDPAVAQLEADAAQGLELSDRTVRRVQDSVAEAAEADPQFAALLQQALAHLDRAERSASSAPGIDLRQAKGTQVGNFNTQTNTFN